MTTQPVHSRIKRKLIEKLIRENLSLEADTDEIPEVFNN